MIEKNFDLVYNKKYLVVVPQMSKELFESFNYSFHNTILMQNTVEDTKIVTDFINRNNFDQIIFVDYQIEYEQIINDLKRKHPIKMIFTKALGALSDQFIYYTFKGLYKLYEEGMADSIGFLDKGLYDVFKHKKEKVEHICLDIPRKKVKEEITSSNTVGVLNSEHNARHSYYNELSAIKLTNKYTAKLIKYNKVTKKFLKTFNLKNVAVSTQDEVIENNIVNLYVNFTANNNLLFLKSMDLNIPCILGNNEILKDEEDLKKYLVVKSDDDINEIAEKIENANKNRDIIIKKYQTFRKKYSQKSKESIEKFLGCKIEEIEEIEENKESDILITIVVPVYNTENYLENTLDSIIDAVVDKTEILLINDGSKDNSEEIILKYQKKYPNLIRYIKQENHGLGNVRNVGLKEAKGKYIASIDSDDTVDLSFFTDAIEYLENDVDILMYDWKTVTNDDSYDTPALDYVFNNESVYEGILYTTIMPSTCNKIIKKSLYDNLDLKFIEDKYEDLSANPFILLSAKTIKYIKKPYYEYYIRSNSLMRTSAGYSMIDVLKIFEERLQKYKEYVNVDINKFKYYTYAWRIEEYIINQLYTIEESEIKTFIKYIYDNFKDILNDIIDNKYYIERIETLKDEKKKFIFERNKAFKENKLETFIRKSRKENKYFKLTPPIMYYGDNDNE